MEDMISARKLIFILTQGVLLFSLFGFAMSLASSGVLSTSMASDQDMQAARRSALGYVFLLLVLWLLNWIIG